MDWNKVSTPDQNVTQPSSRRNTVWFAAALGIIILVAAVAGAGYWLGMKKTPPITQIGSATLVRAEEGKVLAGFPVDLIKEEAAPKESYSVEYPGNVKQWVVSYKSARPMRDNMMDYAGYFMDKNWTISNVNQDESNAVNTIYAQHFVNNVAKEEVNVTLARDLEGHILVTLAYLQK